MNSSPHAAGSPSASTTRRFRHGFTLVEILVGILILGLLMAVLTYTLTGSLRLNQQSQGEINQTSAAQELLENIRNAWNEPDHAKYDRVCAPLTPPPGYTVKVINLDSRAQPLTAGDPGIDVRLNPPGGTVDCLNAPIYAGPTAVVPRMRRLVVSSGQLPRDITLTLDVLR